ncbi:DgyrCDS11284 [Dimorphilus gyrociliatus]|uniref:DgyrCDS11284 n=1 Tax=Dimorphilus gyrociliatus TaxID=2664684 RepID=A0A7I8W7N5_9ANNE|nr:DgyrCDS11284 [Dimorphilus gyrociliatus]
MSVRSLNRKFLLIYTIICFTIVFSVSGKLSKQLQNSVDKYKEELPECSIKEYDNQIIDKWLSFNKIKAALSCLIKRLEEFPREGVSWVKLCEGFRRLDEDVNVIDSCFKHASKYEKVNLQGWHFLGPFVIGKTEIDGDSIFSFGNITEILRSRYTKKEFFSELVMKGTVSWKHIGQSKEGYIQIIPSVLWNDLVNTLGSMGVTEWQGMLVGHILVASDKKIVQMRCTGVHTVYINNIPVANDLYHRQQYWFNVPVKRGINHILLRVRSKVRFDTQCIVRILNEASLIAYPPHFLPDLLDGHILNGYIPLPVIYPSQEKSISIGKIKLKIIKQSYGRPLTISIRNQFSIVGGQITTLQLIVKTKDGNRVAEDCSKGNLKLTIKIADQTLNLELLCRNLDQSFVFTFVDHDDSIQQAAAIVPLNNCGLCSIVLTLHGTTVPPRNHADSYKRGDGKGDFIFGIENSFILAPSRHGAHNWEGPGSLTALTSLSEFEKLIKTLDFIHDKASSEHVIYAGHSMGGHGAWHLATHYPDKALGVIALAGWISKESYGDSNLFFVHDQSLDFTDPITKYFLEASIAENNVNRLVSNLHDIPIMVRVGSSDRTVHPFFSRKMLRLLKQHLLNVTYSEIKGKEHWWWDTWETNDGGATNDEELRKFTIAAASLDDIKCDSNKCNNEMPHSLYRKQTQTKFQIVVINPAGSGPVNGLHVLRQIIPMRETIIKVEKHETFTNISTKNAEKLRFSDEYFHHILYLDGNEVFTETLDTIKIKDFCFIDGKWERCLNDADKRNLNTLGPARRVAEHKFAIVLGTLSDSETLSLFQHMGVYLANQFFLTSDSYVPIIKDTDVNNYEGIIKLGSCQWSDAGVLSLAPISNKHGLNNRLALLLYATNMERLLDILSLASPTIPPMARSPFSNLIPDFIITNRDFRSTGHGSYDCTGFWDNDWRFRSHLVSCSHCTT